MYFRGAFFIVMNIKFNIPLVLGQESEAVNDAIERGEFSAGGHFTQKCEKMLSSITGCPNVLLTSSCTHALEMSALLIDINEGDEVIMSSYTFVSSANAFALYGAKIVFVDIDPDTMNIDAEKIENAITSRTKAIVLMHYGAIPCETEKIVLLAKTKNIFIIEDAAHCIYAFSDTNHLGTFGDFGTLSFHATKNIHCGEGGALLINNKKFIEQAEIIREKGTNRQAFKRGEISKYNWIGLGSSYLLSEISAAYLSVQLSQIEKITTSRKIIFDNYRKRLTNIFDQNDLSPMQPKGNGHIFYIKTNNRDQLTNFLTVNGVPAFFHYIPLHSSPYGKGRTRFVGNDTFTTAESKRLLRLPIYYNFSHVDYVVDLITTFVKENGN